MHSYDGWGRQYRSEVQDSATNPTIVDTAYDFEGKTVSVSNPYRNTPVAGDPPNGSTSYTYDALGRKTIQTQPDGSTQQWCYDGVATTGQTNCFFGGGATTVDIADETGRRSVQTLDALGRLINVLEPDPITRLPSLSTQYGYDAFDDLVSVAQVGNNNTDAPVYRNFTYDMPGRVVWSCNPEVLSPGQDCTSGTYGINYSYDANDNLSSKTDNRGITTYYAYDHLNRLLSKTYYSDSSGTASSCYQYDGSSAANLSGRLAVQWTQQGTCPSSLPGTGVLTKTAITSYDAMGRLLTEQRCMGVTNCASGGYAMTYTYDYAGKLSTYPSGFGGFSFSNLYDAAGRLSSLSSGGTPLFSSPYYTPSGSLSAVQLGSSIQMNRTFDNRQRVTSETDSGNTVGNTPGSATVSITGSEQSN